MTKRSSNNLRPRTPSQVDREEPLPSPTLQPHLRGASSSRAASPSTSRANLSSTANLRDLPTNRPPSVHTQPQQVGSRLKVSRPLNAELSNQSLSPNHPAALRPSRDNYGTPRTPDNSTVSAPYPTSTQHSRPPSPSSIRTRKQSIRSIIPNDPGGPPPRRDQNARISFYDTGNQAALDRLISGGAGINSDVEGDDDNALSTMTNVEEMIEGYEWASDDVIARKSSRGAADLIEARLLDELMALEKVFVCRSLPLLLIYRCPGQHTFFPGIR